MILERLNDARDSDTIEWAISLADETDQRHVLGNLQNRLQIGQFSLNNCFEKIHKDAAAELKRCQVAHKKQIDEKISSIWELEKLLTDAIAVNRRYEERMRFIIDKGEHSEQMLDAMRSSLRKLRKDCNDNKDTTTKLHNDFCRLRSATETLLHELRTARQRIQVLDTTVVEQREDIEARDAAMQQLEKLLENITHRYAENERLRIRVTHDAAVQAVAKTIEVCCVADFLPTPLRTVATEDDNKSKSIADVLLPGRIIQLQNDENWPLANHPSRINVRPPAGQVKVQYRRAIDRL
jgi:chromosome segregation ATPase